MPKFGNFDGAGMLDRMKARLGLDDSRRAGEEEPYDELDENYDDASDGYDGAYGDEWSEYIPDSYGNRGDSGSRRSSYRSDTPRLVSIGDVKRHTASERLSQSAPAGRVAFDDAAQPVDSPAYRGDGVDSLFQPTSPIEPVPAASAVPAPSAYDPYDALLANTPSAYSAVRSMTVIKPVSYSDVQRVAKSVKSGDVVVLVMRNTPDDLMKRILDFSFGVASALDASVECPGDKVFAIACGAALSEDEKLRLRNQGAL